MGEQGEHHEHLDVAPLLVLADACTVLALVLCGCDEAKPVEFSPCAVGGVVTVAERSEDLFAPPVLLSDERGYVLFWGGEYILSTPESSGVFAARPGEPTVRIEVDVWVQTLTAAPVAGGFLVCWSDCAGRLGEARRGECLTVDADFRVVRGPARPSFGVVTALLRLSGGLWAVTWPDLADGGPSSLVPIDETAASRGAPVPAPCFAYTCGGPSAGFVAWTDAGIACLAKSAPACGAPLDEPPDCAWGVELYDLAGSLSATVSGVAPFGRHDAIVDATVAARSDGYLVSWLDQDGWHAQAIGLDGTRGIRTDVAAGSTGWEMSALSAIPAGYVASWSEAPAGSPGEDLVSRMAVLGPDGTLLAGPMRLGEGVPGFPSQYGHAAVAAGTGDGWALAWTAANGLAGADYRIGLLFRAMGCEPQPR